MKIMFQKEFPKSILEKRSFKKLYKVHRRALVLESPCNLWLCVLVLLGETSLMICSMDEAASIFSAF